MVKLGTREEWKSRPVDLIGKEGCPFCDNIKEKEYVIWTGKYWNIKLNKYPYTGDEFHVMAVPVEHVEFNHQLSHEAFAEMREVHIFINEYFLGKEYFSFTRETFGDRSIKHLHMHFLPGKLSPKKIIESLQEEKNKSK